ncbi:hypothetical protein AALP_AA2G108000 [Arabis alpina]|uniref:Uncharacterized protein n=1 Tax=Arabis alpina TaxID=50452 RepID=A0A087HGL7_ARAAL|nr:hypothetical protein AALP_AA2G108000 [Arabis alpina]
MASPSNNNSSFSPPIPNRPNPKPRNSESCDPLRRSFGGNPFPQANSKDLSRRNSFGSSDKENAITTPKATKNFMSPTISAVSKINASPRKKVLSDKNELSRSEVKGLLILEETKTQQSRSCVSFSDVTIGVDEKKKRCVSFSDVTNIIIGVDETKRFDEGLDDMTVTDFDENEVLANKGVVYSDPRFIISPRSSVPYASPEFVGGEIGSLLPPYDPKKNYLSPRPQFLHYKPNPRIEQRFDECKQLDELFVSESSSSDTEFSTAEDDASPKGGVKAVVVEEEEEEEGETDDVVELEEEEEGETEDVVELEEESDEEVVCESIEETSQVPKQSGFKKLRFLGWFLALALGCLLVSVTFSPPTGLLKESPFYKFHIPREVTEFARANNLEKLSEKLWSLTESSLVYMEKLMSSVGGREEEYGPLRFHNLTYTLEDSTVFQPTSVEISVAELDYEEPEEMLQEKSQGENNLEDGYVNDFEESGETSEVVCETKDEQAEMEPGTDIELNEGEGNSEAVFEATVERNTEEQIKPEVIPEETNDAGARETQEMLETVLTKKLEDYESEAINIDQHNVESDASITVDQHNVESDASITMDLQKENVESVAESEAIYINQHDVESDAANNEDPQKENEIADAESGSETSEDVHLSKTDKDLSMEMIVLSSTVLVLLAAVAFLFSKKAKPVAASAPEPALETTEELNLSHVPEEKLSPLSFEVEEVDDRTSSSFHKKSSSQSKNRVSKERDQSGVGKKRRESTASSASEYSVGSFSYGSFTTYEKIPIKSGGEEEMVTPVRRSSRIRNIKPSGL